MKKRLIRKSRRRKKNIVNTIKVSNSSTSSTSDNLIESSTKTYPRRSHRIKNGVRMSTAAAVDDDMTTSLNTTTSLPPDLVTMPKSLSNNLSPLGKFVRPSKKKIILSYVTFSLK